MFALLRNSCRHFGPALPAALTALAFIILACGRTDEPLSTTRAEADVRAAQKATGLSAAEIKKRMLEVEQERRRCGRSRKTNQECAALVSALERKLALPEEDLPQLRTASIALGWEKAELEQRTRLPEAEARRLFARIMQAHSACEAQAKRAKRTIDCDRTAVFPACAAAGLGADDCGLLVSVGIDSGWRTSAGIRVERTPPNVIPPRPKKD